MTTANQSTGHNQEGQDLEEQNETVSTENNSSSNNTNKKKCDYPSAELLLSTIQKEYDNEASRKRDIETRTGILIALLGALIGFYTSTIDFSIVKKASSPIEYLCVVFIGMIYIFPLITFFLSMKELINVLKTKTYQRIGIGGINETMAKKCKEEVSVRLAKSYKAVVEDNGKSNEKKALQFQKGILLIYISLIGIIVAYIVKQVVSLIAL